MTKKDKKIIYNQGQEAKNRGFERISPYKNLKAEIYWLKGFDGEPLE